MPREYVAEALAESFAAERLAGARVLIPSAALARDVVPRFLRTLGAEVDVVEAYRNIIPSGARERLQHIMRKPLPDWVTFASPSAVENAVELAGVSAFREVKIASIGPVTSNAIRAHALPVATEAEPHTVTGLVAALESAHARSQ
jgi:uroporphyrinogen III methyltransferase/synthase